MLTTFAQRIQSKQSVITVELSPPKGTDPSLFLSHAQSLKGLVHAINVPDCQRSILKMSSMAAACLVQQRLGMEAVWQLTGRDRNVIALQADMLGAWAMGLRNLLALTGDPVAVGDQADVAKQVSHVDALRMLEVIRQLNDGKDATGKDFRRGGTAFCYGAALNPHRMSREAQIHRLQAKLALGVQYFQTQPVYDFKTVAETQTHIQSLCSAIHIEPPRLLVGIIPPKSADFARFMNQKILGISIPEDWIDTLSRSQTPVEDSLKYCADLVAELAPVVDGFHLMPVGIEGQAARFLELCYERVPSLAPVLAE